MTSSESNSSNMDTNNHIPSSIFGASQYRPYSPYQNNSFYLNPAACSSMQYDGPIHAHPQHIHGHSHHPHHPHHAQHSHHPHHQPIGHSQNSVAHSSQNQASLDYFRAIHQYGYSAFSRDIDDRKEVDGEDVDSNNNNNKINILNSSKSQSPADRAESSQLQNDRDTVRTLLASSNHSDALSDDVIEESYDSDYDEDDDEEDDSTRLPSSLNDHKSTRIVRPTTIYISSTSVLHSSVLNNDWARAVSEHFQRSFALSKLNNHNFFPQDDEPSNPDQGLNAEGNDHADDTVNDPQNDTNNNNSAGSVNNPIEANNVHSDKENESPSKLELTKVRPFQKRLERRRRRQQKRLQLLYTPFRKRKLPANFFQPPSPPQTGAGSGTGCYYSNPYSTYNAGSSSNYYSSAYNVTPGIEQSPQNTPVVDNEPTPVPQYSTGGPFYEPSAFYDPLNGQSLAGEQQSSVKVKTEVEPNQLLNYSNSSNSSSNVSYPATKIRSAPLSLSVSMTIGGSGAGNSNVVDSSPSSFNASHQNSVTSQQHSQGTSVVSGAHPGGGHRPVQSTAAAAAAAAASSSSAAAAAAAALATLNNDLTLDMSIHISPLTLSNHHAHHGQQQSNYNGHNTSHQQSGTYPSQHLVQQAVQQCQQSQQQQSALQQQQQQQQQTPQQQQASQQSQALSQSGNNLSNLFQESHTYYYHHHQSANSGSHYQYASKSSADPANQCQQYSFGYYSAPNPSGATNPVNQQSVIYPTDYSSMSRLHQPTPSTSNVATAAHIFSSLYSLAGQAGN